MRGINGPGDLLFHFYWVYLLSIGWLMKKIYAMPRQNYSNLCFLFLLTTARFIAQMLTNMFIENTGGHSASMIFTLNFLFMNIGINLFLPILKKLACTFFITSLCLYQVMMQQLYLANGDSWEEYSTEERLHRIGKHLYDNKSYSMLIPVMIIILFLESMTHLFIAEILKVFAK